MGDDFLGDLKQEHDLSIHLGEQSMENEVRHKAALLQSRKIPVVRNENSNPDVSDAQLTSFIPTDYSDVAQGTLLAQAYHHCLCYCNSIGWLVYKDGVWTASDIEAHRYSQELTKLQFEEAMTNRYVGLQQGRVLSEIDKYLGYVQSRRTSARITATLKEAMPMLSIETDVLDGDPLVLNTPCGEVNLSTGEMMHHDPLHYITHKTKVSPSNEGAEIWGEFLLQIACGDESVAEFLQQFAGMAAIGKVYEERLVIAVGSGGNGKSTFFNAIQDVLGDYAGTIRSELMIASNDSGKKFEYARLRGKRFIIAEELSEGKQLDTGAVKQLCSTGDINAQFKGKDIFTFKPSHSTVLCTNHMPTVKTVDDGTWDRLIVIPFKGRFRNQETEIKNYGAYLVEHCGGAILRWIIEGAQKYVQNDYRLIVPEVILAATKSYQEENDWAADFFRDSLVFEAGQSATGSELYDAYQKYCGCAGINPLPSSVVLPRIAEHPGVMKKRMNKGTRYFGVGISKPESLNLLQNQHRVGRCRDENRILNLMDEIFG